MVAVAIYVGVDSICDIVVRDRDPAEEEIPSVILPAQDSK